ncbi:MAG: F0F1 ATP synthase subunit delta [Candidatus Saccharibacteria bacterium]
MKPTRHQLAETIGRQTLGIVDMDSLAIEVAAYLVAEQQVFEFDSLIRDIMQYRASNGVVEVTAVSAHQMDDQNTADISELLKVSYPDATTIRINQVIDPDVLGGVRLDFPNEVLDMTTRTNLNKFKRLTGAGKV